MLNYKVGGFEVAGYHLVNIAVHALVGMLVFCMLSSFDKVSDVFRLKKPQKRLFIILASVCWLVNPVHTQSVTYIVQRMNSMAVLFFLISFVLYCNARFAQINKAKKSYEILFFTGSFFSFLFAVGCKEIAIILPVIILLFEIIIIKQTVLDIIKKHKIAIILTLICISGIYIFLRNTSPVDLIMETYVTRTFTLEERLLTQLRVVVFYIFLIIYPNPGILNLDHHFKLSHGIFDPATTFYSFIVILALIIIAFAVKKKEPVFSFCILSFFCCLLIESSVFGLEIIFEHRTYLPSVFLISGLFYYLFKFFNYKVICTFCCLYICLFSYWTVQRNLVWADEQTIWEDCAKKSPEKARPYNNLGIIYAQNGNNLKAMKSYMKAYKINPKCEKTCNNLGIEFMRIKDFTQAERYLLEALEIKPNFPYALNSLAKLYHKKGDDQSARQFYEQNVSANPDNDLANRGYGYFLFQKKEYSKALHYYRRALEIKETTENFVDLGAALAAVGKEKEAVSYFLKAAKLDPGNQIVKKNVLALLSELHKRIELQIAHQQKEKNSSGLLERLFHERQKIEKLQNRLITTQHQN